MKALREGCLWLHYGNRLVCTIECWMFMCFGVDVIVVVVVVKVCVVLSINHTLAALIAAWDLGWVVAMELVFVNLRPWLPGSHAQLQAPSVWGRPLYGAGEADQVLQHRCLPRWDYADFSLDSYSSAFEMAPYSIPYIVHYFLQLQSSWQSLLWLYRDKLSLRRSCEKVLLYARRLNQIMYIVCALRYAHRDVDKLIQLKSKVYIHLSQTHLNSFFHNSWHLIQVKIPCLWSVRITTLF